MEKLAVSLDLDGVVFKRYPYQFITLCRYLRYGVRIYQTPETIPEIERGESYRPLGLLESISLLVQGRKGLKKGVSFWLSDKSSQADIFGNTGRSDNVAWVKETEKVLERDHIDQYFQTIFFKPQKLNTVLSKAAGIKELEQNGYQRIFFVDDDPGVVLPLADLFPEVSFFLIEDRTTRILLPTALRKKHSNVHVVSSLCQVSLH